MKIIALTNQKGGVGKTTSAINIGAGLVRLGKRVLLVDLDPSAHLTASLGLDPADAGCNVCSLLMEQAVPSQAARPHDKHLLVMPGTADLLDWEGRMASSPKASAQLGKMLSMAGMDYILLDCPPTMGLLTLNALVAADGVCIPVQAEYLALQAIASLMQLIGRLRKKDNPGLEVLGILITRYDGRKVLNREVAEKIREHFPQHTFATAIRENISLAEAPSYGQTIFTYKPDCTGAQDYLETSREFIARSAR